VEVENQSVIPDRDVWRAVLLIVKRYGAADMLEASEKSGRYPLVHVPDR
jgi:hypothetical protein